MSRQVADQLGSLASVPLCMYADSFAWIWDFDAAPVKPSTAEPFLNIVIVGMLCILKAAADNGFSSILTFPNTTFPA